jgi:hypothetical protein
MDPLCHFVAEIRGAPSLRFGVTAKGNGGDRRPVSQKRSAKRK